MTADAPAEGPNDVPAGGPADVGVRADAAPSADALLAAVVAGSADAIIGVSRDGTVLSWNPAAERLFGFTAAEMVGQPLQRIVPPDGLAELEAINARVLAGAVLAVETVRVTRDGRRLDVRLTSAPIRDADGRVLGRVATLADISARREGERARAAVEERLTLAFDSAEDGYWDWDLTTGASFLSPGWHRLLGYEPGELPAQAESWERLMHPEDRASVWAALEAHFGGATSQYEVEQRLRHKRGHWVWMHARGKVVARAGAADAAGGAAAPEHAPGRPLRMVGTLVDVSARKEAELALRERERDQQFLAELGAALQTTTDPVTLGEIGLARLAERFAAPICGWATHDAPTGAFTVQQEYQDGRVDAVGRMLPGTVWPPATLPGLGRGETLAVDDVATHPLTAAWHAAGASRWPERRAALLAPMRRDGAWVGTVGLFDVVPRAWPAREQALFRTAAERVWFALEMARALREADLERRRLRAVLEALPVGVLVAEADGAIVHFSEPLARLMRGARLAASVAEYAVYRGWWTETGAPLAPEEWGLARALRDGTTSLGELIDIERLDGTRATVLNSAAPVRDAEGRIVGAVAAVMDVTEQRSLEARLRHAQKLEAVGQLAGGIAHDFNNLLTVIGANLEFVREAVEAALPSAHPARADLEEIGRSAERARVLVRQLLAFSRQQQLRPHPVRVAALVHEAERMLHRVLGAEIELAVHVADASATVLADPGQLEQVLVNLAVNARDAMLTGLHGHAGTGGTLTLEVDTIVLSAGEARAWGELAPGRHVRLVVHDSGHGMDVATQARAFDPFFTTKPVGQGTGLGLATVHGVVRQLGGVVRVDSAPGRGATFTILIPALDVPARVGERSGSSEPGETRPTDVAPGAPWADAPGGAKDAPRAEILLVEDEEAVRAIARRALERAGYQVREARHGGDALELWRGHRGAITALVTDLRMPVLGGRALVAALREEVPRLPVVFMSGYADEGAVAPVGPYEVFLPKPFTTDGLLAAVARVLRHAASRAPGGARRGRG